MYEQVLSSIDSVRTSKHPKDKTVFLSHRFAEIEMVDGLSRLLDQSGFTVIKGKSANTYVSQSVIAKIQACEFFLA